jgi:hypothetical protein
VFELKASCLLGRCSTAWATPQPRKVHCNPCLQTVFKILKFFSFINSFFCSEYDNFLATFIFFSNWFE